MIFVTVGSELPFDRMIRTVDEWARQRRCVDVFAQIGPADWQPSGFRWVQFLDSADFQRHMDDASLIVSHAGMGTILSALYRAKPILVMPRRGDLRESRNDHQVATARRFSQMGRVQAAFDEAELRKKLEQHASIGRPEPIGAHASPELVQALRSYFDAA